jgi:putative oxidoreductase
MSMLRVAARVITGSAYLAFGLDVLRDAGGRPQVAADTLAAIRHVVPLPADDTLVVRANGAVQATAGALLAVGVLPRLSALALVGSLVPTTLAGHAFWTIEDKTLRKQQQIQFVKNLAMLGGLLYAVAGGLEDRVPPDRRAAAA